LSKLPTGKTYSDKVDALGYVDFDGKPAFKLAIQEVKDRWYLYVAHLWHPGWSVVDVTDPEDPKELRYIKGPDNTWTIQLQIAEGRMVTAFERMPPPWGGDAAKPYEESALIWDVSNPVEPEVLGQYSVGQEKDAKAGAPGGSGTHRNYYDGGRYAHLSLKRPGFSRNMYQIIDIADPRNPKDVGQWWVPGQWHGGGENPSDTNAWLHGGPYVVGDRVYLSYGSAGLVILDISDITKPSLVGQLSFCPPFNPNIGMHSAIPIPDRKLVVVNSEAIAENCAEPANYTALVDVSEEKNPRLASIFPTPVPPAEAPYRNYCVKGGRFGPHNQHQWQHQDCLYRNDNLVFMTWFNAGLRIFDISDPWLPKEVAFFEPPDPVERRGKLPTKLVCSSEDVVVDARGVIYMSDKNHGVYLLKAHDAVYDT
jgi:hypothetical protein